MVQTTHNILKVYHYLALSFLREMNYINYNEFEEKAQGINTKGHRRLYADITECSAGRDTISASGPGPA